MARSTNLERVLVNDQLTTAGSFDNTASGLTADNVKGAIDELNNVKLDDTYIKVNSTGTGALALFNETVAIGASAVANGDSSIAIGFGASTEGGEGASPTSIALGKNAKVEGNASSAVQIGTGLNIFPNTFQFLTNRLADAAGLYTSYSSTNYITGTPNIDSHLSGIDTVLGTLSTASHAAVTLDAGDATQETLDLTGQVITVNLATTTTDGAFAATDKVKLDGIEVGATADQTGAEIKALYEAEADTNAFTDAEKTKLGTVETNAAADQNAAEVPVSLTATNYTAATANVEAHLVGIHSEIGALQTTLVGGVTYKGGYNANVDFPALTSEVKTLTGTAALDDTVNVVGTGTAFLTEVVSGDSITIAGETRVVDVVTDNTNLTVTVAFTAGTVSAQTITKDAVLITIEQGDMYTVTADGTFFSQVVTIGDVVIAEISSPTVEADWTVVETNLEDAADVAFNNVASGLTATNVQGAIDELSIARSHLALAPSNTILLDPSTGNDSNDGFSVAVATIERVVELINTHEFTGTITISASNISSYSMTIAGILPKGQEVRITNGDVSAYTGIINIDDCLSPINLRSFLFSTTSRINIARCVSVQLSNTCDIDGITGTGTFCSVFNTDFFTMSNVPIINSTTMNYFFYLEEVRSAIFDFTTTTVTVGQGLIGGLSYINFLSLEGAAGFNITGRLINIPEIHNSTIIYTPPFVQTLPDVIPDDNTVNDSDYDNTTSGLAATTKQTAINELASNQRIKLTADTDLYVDATLGTDTSGAGITTGAGAYATIQFALDDAAQLYDLNNYQLTFNLSAETHTITSTIELPDFVGGGHSRDLWHVSVDGINATTCTIDCNVSAAPLIIASSIKTEYEFRQINFNNINCSSIGSLRQAIHIDFNGCRFAGTFSDYLFNISNNSLLTTGFLSFNALTAPGFYLVGGQGKVDINGNNTFLASTANSFTDTFVKVEPTGSLFTNSGAAYIIQSGATVTGKRFEVSMAASVVQAGGLNLNLFPGDTAGTIISSGFEGVNYNNTTSGLAATNIQAAIDEVEGRVDDLEALNPAAPQPITVNRETITVNKTLANTDEIYQHIISNTAALLVDLPASPINGTHFIIKNASSSSESFTTNSVSLAPGNLYEVIYDGTEWVVL